MIEPKSTDDISWIVGKTIKDIKIILDRTSIEELVLIFEDGSRLEINAYANYVSRDAYLGFWEIK